MNHLNFYYDPVSPYAYLAFEALPQALAGTSYSVRYVPILFAGQLKHYGQLGPAEIAPKRSWTYRQVLWQAKVLGVPLDLPSHHPFNPLPLLRLATACGEQSADGITSTNRMTTEKILYHVWRGQHADGANEQRLAALRAELALQIKVDEASAKVRLITNTQLAIQQNCFGVPTVVAISEKNQSEQNLEAKDVSAGAQPITGKNFWGLDSLPMLRAYLDGDAWFEPLHKEGWESVHEVGTGVVR